MRLGIWTPLPHTIRSEPAMEAAVADTLVAGRQDGPDKAYAFAVEVIQRAEGLGFETTLIAERLMGPDLECWILASALAARTQSIELMVAVHPGIMTPQMAAKMGASLDRISGGRLAINIVNGWWQQEFDLFANGGWLEDPTKRYARMGEFVRVMKGLWQEDRFSMEGFFYPVERGQLPIKPVRTPHPPLYAASRADAGRTVVAEQCDCWFVNYAPFYAAAAENLVSIEADIADMRERAAKVGRTLDFGISGHVICADNMEAAEEKAAELTDYGKRNPVAAVAAKALGAGLVGTPDLIIERLTRYADMGISCPMLHFHPMMDGLERFAEKVMPQLPA